MEKHRNLSYLEQLLEDINRAEQDRFEVRKLNAFKVVENSFQWVSNRLA